MSARVKQSAKRQCRAQRRPRHHWLRHCVDQAIAQVVIAAIFGLGGVLGLVAFGLVLRTGRLSSRATRVFRRQYSTTPRVGNHRAGVWWLIKESSTDALDRVAYTANVGDWRRHDRRLSAGFARAWDQAVRMPPRRRSVSMRRDASALARQTEQWALRTLLRTERANIRYAYPLPVLTCRYRVARRLPAQATSTAFKTDGGDMVANTDFVRSMQRHGVAVAPILESASRGRRSSRLLSGRRHHGRLSTWTGTLGLLSI